MPATSRGNMTRMRSTGDRFSCVALYAQARVHVGHKPSTKVGAHWQILRPSSSPQGVATFGCALTREQPGRPSTADCENVKAARTAITGRRVILIGEDHRLPRGGNSRVPRGCFQRAATFLTKAGTAFDRVNAPRAAKAAARHPIAGATPPGRCGQLRRSDSFPRGFQPTGDCTSNGRALT